METKDTQDYSLGQVPRELTRGWAGMFLTLIAIGVDLSSVILGSDLSHGFPVKEAILAVMVGSFFAAILYTLCSLVGSKTGLSTAMITEHIFGRIGAKLFSLIIGVSLLGWFGVQLGFFAENAHTIILAMLSIDVSVKILSVIGGILMTSTAIIGYRALEKLSIFSVPFLLGLMIITLGMALKAKGLGGEDIIENPMTFVEGVSFTMSIGIVGAIIAPDIGRWSRTKKDCLISSFFGILFGNSFMIIISILLMKSFKDMDIMSLFIALGLGIPGIFILTLAQWTTNTSNLYSAALGFTLIFKKSAKVKLTIILGIIATLLSVFGIYNNFIDFLSMLSIFLAPVGGIYVCDFFIVKKRLEVIKTENIKTEILPMISWGIGIIITFITTYGYLTITSLPPLDGFGVGFVSLYIFEKIADILKQKKTEIA